MNSMKSVRAFFSFAIFTAAASIGFAADSEAAKKDLSQLQGEWTMVSSSADGQAMPDPMVKQMKRVCKGDELIVTMSGNTYFKARITIDPSKTPRTIDYAMTEGLTKGKQQFGIYELNGDTFKSCFAKPGADRPTDFKPGEGRTVSVWKREKAEPKSEQK
jgi:uncharacterized protein (TIGR03067 family)